MSVGQYCIGPNCGNIEWPVFSITVSVFVLQHVYIHQYVLHGMWELF